MAYLKETNKGIVAEDEVVKVLQARLHGALETPYDRESVIGNFEGFKQDVVASL